MADKETILREKTFKEDGLEVSRRVFYTLSDTPKTPAVVSKPVNIQAHRTTLAVALLIEKLHEKSILSDEELDDLLFDCAR